MKTLILAAATCAAAALLSPTRQDPAPPADGRIATVTDLQGRATVRPIARQRWSPLCRRAALLAGDIVRTPLRGAHAIEIALESGGRLLLGPGTQLELGDGGVVRLQRGDVEVTAPEKVTVNLSDGRGFERAIAGSTQVVRAVRDGTAVLATAPRWLTGYRESTTDEWMGSLVAQVDGRDVPLSVGYHSVDAVIHDQIAQTTVEQSFVNSTDARLEGVFYFPLPADASISGFGMWVGGELVEADIVEKQRARAIYEDILRRKKDPGLLEWSGGNMFKARVFPIEAHAEKRIRIRYTQVLPLHGDKFHYHYALRSELLRQHPVRELAVKLSISSSTPIASVSSTSHTVRTRHTEHAATVEFDAQSFRPERDFDIAIQLNDPPAVSAIAHQRGNDGYFMLSLTPPDETAGVWQRDLVPDGEPLDLVIVADTSASMDAAARHRQSEFISTILDLLGDADQFSLVAADVEPRWWRATSATATEQNRREALAFLAARPSLGWTDLDGVFAEVAQKSDGIAIYVGDGIGTTGNADPVALAERIRTLDVPGAEWHGVATGSTYERPVLDAIASHGGAVQVVRDDVAAAAYQLLAEVARPPLRDVEIEVRGVATARVYPEKLPPLPAGRQQIVLGRYLPGERPATGEVIVRGVRDGVAVSYRSELTLPAAGAGNSFLPRLWARRHLDSLLESGDSEEVQKQIVEFSQEYDIITPLTSFLVLESDEDRARYGVERRVKMRDGETLFAQARERADAEILRQQMLAARTWRLRLRTRMLQEIARLGRDLHASSVAEGTVFAPRLAGGGGARLGVRGGERLGFEGRGKSAYRGPGDSVPPADFAFEGDFEDDARLSLARELPGRRSFSPAGPTSAGPRGPSTPGPMASDEFFMGAGRRADLPRDYRGRAEQSYGYFGRRAWPGANTVRASLQAFGFPWLAPAPSESAASIEPAWDPALLAVLRPLAPRQRWAARNGAVHLQVEAGEVHALQGTWQTHERVESWLSDGGWWTQRRARGQQARQEWSFGGERGVLAAALRLGARRPSAPEDIRAWVSPGHELYPDLMRSFFRYTPRVVRRDGAILVVSFSASSHEMQLTIDTEKQLVVEAVSFTYGRMTRTERRGDPIEVAGVWWPTTGEATDAEDRVVWRMRTMVTGVDAPTANAALKSATNHGGALFLTADLPELGAAKQAAHDGDDGIADRLVLLAHYASSQQWQPAWEQMSALTAMAEDKPGLRWVRTRLLSDSRRGEQLLQTLKAPLAVNEAADAPFAADYLLALAGDVDAHDQLSLVEALAGAIRDSGEDSSWAEVQWQRRRAGLLQSVGERAAASALRGALAAAHPRDIGLQIGYLRALIGDQRNREVAAAAAAALGDGTQWLPAERDQLYTVWTDALWHQRDLVELARVCANWTASRPTTSAAYQRLVSVMLFRGLQREADEWLTTQLTRELVDGDLAQHASISASLQLVLGRGWNFWVGELTERWHAPLAAAARNLIDASPEWSAIADTVMQDYRFQRTDAYRQLRADLIADLRRPGQIASMTRARLLHLLELSSWSRTEVDETTWHEVVDRLHQRWVATANAWQKLELGTALMRLFDMHADPASGRAFARERLAAAIPGQRVQLAYDLSRRLSKAEWTEARERELIALRPNIVPPGATPSEQRVTNANYVRWLADQLYSSRLESALGPAEAREKSSRAVQHEQRQAAIALVRGGLADALQANAAVDDDVGRWFELEQLGYRAQLHSELASIEAAARSLLAAIPAAPSDDPAYSLLRTRTNVLLSYLATRREAGKELAERVLTLFRERADTTGNNHEQQYEVFRLLLALDRPDELEATVRSWIKPSAVVSDWRVTLAYLLAERGDVAGAARQFEEVRRRDELSPEDFGVLANWYLVLGDDDHRAEAQLARYLTMPVAELEADVRRDVLAYSRRGDDAPPVVETATLLRLRALLAKSTQPGRQLPWLRQIYEATKDVRVLAGLADGVLGHAPQAVYQFVGRAAELTQHIHEEATCDEVIARLTRVETRPDLTRTDRRGLHLLRAIVQYRAGRVRNQPSPHLERGMADLIDAFRGPFGPAEGLYLARLLASIGRIDDPRYSAAQLSQLELLRQREPKGTWQRLEVATHETRVLWLYGRHDDAIDRLGAELAALRVSESGALPSFAQTAVSTMIDWMELRGSFAGAERWLIAERTQQPAGTQRDWYSDRLTQLYIACVRLRGACSLGSGAPLYDATRELIASAMFRGPGSLITQSLNRLLELHRAAHDAGIATAATDLARFARESLPEVLGRLALEKARPATSVARVLRALGQPIAALELLVAYGENEQDWRRRTSDNIWQHARRDMGRLRSEAEPLGALEPRLLALVLRELERELRAMSSPNGMLRRGNKYFWSAKTDDFAAVAARVLRDSRDLPARELSVARYLWNGLDRRDRAIAALQTADHRATLPENGRWQLVQWLHVVRDFGGALPVIQRLADEHPDTVAYRASLIVTLHHVGRDLDAGAQLTAAMAHFKESDHWNEATMAPLAKASLQARLFAPCAAIYDELIPLHARTHRDRGVGGATLVGYHGNAALAQAALGNQAAAVDHACAAVVACGRDQQQRNTANNALQKVLEQLPDLDAFARARDQRAERDGQDAPLLRKRIGVVYLERGDNAAAIVQLLTARALDPLDAETHDLLVKAYEREGDFAAARGALLVALAHRPLELGLYRRLAENAAAHGDPATAERAWTSVVEVKPHEAPGHRMLAEQLTRQKRFGEAATQWQQVVRIRTDEPTGWIELAQAEARAGHTDAARKALKHVVETDWDERFGDVHVQAATLLATLPG